MISTIQTALLVKTILKAGAVWMPYERQALDGNGMPQGDAARAGCLIGLEYRKEYRSSLKIDIPGMLVTQDAPRVIGVLPDTQHAPREGDRLCLSGNKRHILAVAQEDRIVTLTLEE